MDFSFSNIIAGGLGAWGGYTFRDLGLVSRFEWVTDERFVVITGILGTLALIAPSYFRAKIAGKVPSAVLYGIGGYLLGAAYGVHKNGSTKPGI